MPKKSIYRVMFFHNDAIYEVYVKKIAESDIFGFLEVEGFLFGETTSLVVDPTEERLKIEFSGVTRSYIPQQAIIRIDEVSKEGSGKIREKSRDSNNTVSLFPLPEKR